MQELKAVVARLVPDAQVRLYGSAAKGKRTADSDYDVLVITQRKLSPSEIRELDGAVYGMQLEREVVLSVAVYAQEEWNSPVFRASPYRRNVLRYGVRL